MRSAPRMVRLDGIARWRRIVVIGPPAAGKTGTLREAVTGLPDIAGFVQECSAARDRYTLVDLRSGARRLVAWRTPAGMRFDQDAFALAARWLGPARILVLDEIGWVEAEGGGHAPALEAALRREAHVVCAVREDRWPSIRQRFGLEGAIVLRAGDAAGVRALLEADLAP